MKQQYFKNIRKEVYYYNSLQDVIRMEEKSNKASEYIDLLYHKDIMELNKIYLDNNYNKITKIPSNN